MTRHVRSLPTLVSCALGALALAAPSALAAKHHAASGAHSGVVLSASHHTLRLVDGHHRVADARVRSTRGLRRGAIVTVRGGRAQVRGHARTISFYGRVTRHSAHGALLRLADGSTFKLASGGMGHGARAASTLTLDVQGLAPGQAVLVTISTDGQGNVVLTIKLVSATTPIGDGEQRARGYVTDATGGGAFAIRTEDGSGLRFGDPQRLFEAADAQQCDTLVVSYHVDGASLVADGVRDTGTSDQGSCAGSSGDQGGGNEIDGTVTALAPDGSSLTVDPGDGSGAATVPVADPTVLDGVSVGDDVAVLTDEHGNATEVDVIDSSSDPSQQGNGGGDGSGSGSGGDGSGSGGPGGSGGDGSGSGSGGDS